MLYLALSLSPSLFLHHVCRRAFVYIVCLLLLFGVSLFINRILFWIHNFKMALLIATGNWINWFNSIEFHWKSKQNIRIGVNNAIDLCISSVINGSINSSANHFSRNNRSLSLPSLLLLLLLLLWQWRLFFFYLSRVFFILSPPEGKFQSSIVDTGDIYI